MSNSDKTSAQPATLTHAHGSLGHTFVNKFNLRVLAGDDKDKKFEVSEEKTVIGTHPSASIILKDPTVSRFHCEIRCDDQGIVVRDLGSRNQTLVNDVPVIHAFLPQGCTLTLGRTSLRFESSDERVTVPVFANDRFGNMVGRSKVMRLAFGLLDKAAKSDATVLLQGETGVGKDIAAESIHENSSRKDKPFVVVDCSAVASNLLESELFGHEKGSFTGAHAQRQGAFEAAHGGTLFLDEIGELSTDLQPKFLRALEQRQIRRVGGTDAMNVDVRVIAATNRQLREEVNGGRFRADLFFRLAVLEVYLPALREHKEDIPLLVDVLLKSLNSEQGTAAIALRSPEMREQLQRHAWPGNVRELRNYVERFVALNYAAPFQSVENAKGTTDDKLPFRLARERWEHHYLKQLMEKHQDNVSAAARAAGLTRVYLHRLLTQHKMR